MTLARKFRELVQRKPTIVRVNDFIGLRGEGIRGQIILAQFPGKEVKVEVIGRVKPHEEQVREVLKHLEESKTDLHREGKTNARRQGAADLPQFLPASLFAAEKALATGKITDEEFRRYRNVLLSTVEESDYLIALGDASADEDGATMEEVENSEHHKIRQKVNEELKRLRDSAWKHKVPGWSKRALAANGETQAQIRQIAKEKYGVEIRQFTQPITGVFEPVSERQAAQIKKILEKPETEPWRRKVLIAIH